jgi:hypothetical protein
MFAGQINTVILKTEQQDGIVRLCEDRLTCSYSIGLRTKEGFHWKYISKELHELLVKELDQQEGFSRL